MAKQNFSIHVCVTVQLLDFRILLLIKH